MRSRLEIPLALFALALILSPRPAISAEPATFPTPSVWELVEVSPVTMMDSNPRGISNHREYYTTEGKVCFLEPVETFPAVLNCLDVSFSLGRRLLVAPDGEEYSSEVLGLTSASFSLRFPDESVFEYQRLDDAAIEAPIRPRSLHVLRVAEGEQLTARDVEYLDPSTVEQPRTLLGVWEVIEHSDVPYMDLPPYGFPNEKWVFTNSHLFRVAPDGTRLADAESQLYTRAADDLRLADEEESLRINYNPWGDLVLTSPRGAVTLRQLTIDAARIPAIPTKVALLVPAQ